MPQTASEQKQDKNYKQNVVHAAKGGSISFAGKISEYGLSLIFVLLMARMLGADQYGIYRLMVTVVTLVSVISLLGLDGGTKRFIAIASRKKNNQEIWGIIQIGLAVPSLVGLITTIILLLTADLISVHLFHNPNLTSILRIGALSIPFLILILSLSCISIGFKKMQFVLYGKDLGFNVAKLVLSVLAIFLGFGLEGVAVAYSLAAIVAVSILAIGVNSHFSFNRPLKSAQRNFKEIMTFSLPLSLTTVVNQFSRKFEILILGIYAIAADIGIFAAIFAISNVGALGFTALRDIASPIIAELHSQNNLKDLERFYQLITKWSLIFNIPFFLIVVLLGENILMLLGKEYTLGAVGLIILCIGTLINAASGTCGALINMVGYSKVNFYNSLIYLASTIVLDFMLIPRYQILGAALAGALSILVVNLVRTVQVYILVNKILPYNKSFFKLLIASIAPFLMVFWMREWVLINHPLIQLIALSMVIGIVFCACIYMLKLSPEDQFILKKIYNAISKKSKANAQQ